MSWISVRNWRKFQHYDPAKRAPKWIKVYAELMSDDAFLGLTGHRRGVLVSLWLEYALSRTCLRLDVKMLNRRLGLDTKMSDWKALADAGFIDILASKPLAECYQDASLEVEVEEEKNPSLPTSTYNAQNGLPRITVPDLRDIPL